MIFDEVQIAEVLDPVPHLLADVYLLHLQIQPQDFCVQHPGFVIGVTRRVHRVGSPQSTGMVSIEGHQRQVSHTQEAQDNLRQETTADSRALKSIVD